MIKTCLIVPMSRTVIALLDLVPPTALKPPLCSTNNLHSKRKTIQSTCQLLHSRSTYWLQDIVMVNKVVKRYAQLSM